MRTGPLTALALVLALTGAAQAQHSDAGFGLTTPDPVPQPVPVPENDPGPGPAPGPEPEPEPAPAPAPAPEPSFAHRVEGTGYVALRTGYTRTRVGLIPTEDQPQLSALLELNGQLKVRYTERSFIYGDLSLIAQAAGNFRGMQIDENGNDSETIVAEHVVPANTPLVSLNELYALHEFAPTLNLTLGKKRVLWGSGQAVNPSDLLNVRKDPTDPTFQRAGAWLARVEVPLETLTFTGVFAPGLLKQVGGVPQQFLTYSGTSRPDEQTHWLAALRAYALVSDADVNLIFSFSNKYNDEFENKFRFAASFSRYFFTDYEFHTEFLIQSGSGRDYVTAACVGSPLEALACAVKGTPFIGKTRLDDPTLTPRLLVGARRQFDDESFLSAEYLYQADGYTAAEYQDLVNALDLIVLAKNTPGFPQNRIPKLSPGASSDGVPQRFAFDPLMQHYLFVTYSKPRIKDDFTAQLVMIANLKDFSTLWTASLAWSATEWLTLSAIGFVPFKGLDANAAKRTSNGAFVTEYGNLPMSYRFLLEARVFY